MGMCAIRGSAGVAMTGDDLVESGGDATPRSSSSCYLSSASQELDAGEVGEVEGEGFEPAGAQLWQRTIPQGRRCRPLSFSGLIVYDATGTQLDYCPRLRRDGRADRVDPLD